MKLPKIKDKERVLKASREKERVTCKGFPIKLSADFSIENLQARRDQKKSIKSHETQGPTSKSILSSKAIIQNGRAEEVLPR